jgi:hypothetical protein
MEKSFAGPKLRSDGGCGEELAAGAVHSPKES